MSHISMKLHARCAKSLSLRLIRTDAVRTCSTSKPFYITCPIFYVNARPHLGHLYTVCLADAWARYASLRNHPSLKPFYQSTAPVGYDSVLKQRSTFLSCGTDEYGTKVRQAAQKHELSPIDYCNQISPAFEAICEANSVEYNDFVRTTQNRHRVAVEEFWRQLDSGGYLYRRNYSGWYSVSDEAFYSDWEVVQSTNCDQSLSAPGDKVKWIAKDTGSSVEWIEENNFVFRLSDFKQDLHKWLDSGVFTNNESQLFWKELSHQLVDTAEDVSVSRPVSRLDWGIPVPGCPDQVIYVWLDALVSYLTVSGYPWFEPMVCAMQHLWPPDVQFFGKDILKFHAVLWPALLMAVELPLPRRLVCHFHLLVDGIKMSKSRGNLIDPIKEQSALWSGTIDSLSQLTAAESDALRFIVLQLPLTTSDASYNQDLAKQIINTQLVNSLGNLLSRITSSRLNPDQVINQLTADEAIGRFSAERLDQELLESLNSLSAVFDHLWWKQCQPHLATKQLLLVISQTNAFLNRHRPWDLKDNTKRAPILSVATESLRLIGTLLQPTVPNLALKLLDRLGVNQNSKTHIVTDQKYRKLGANKGFLIRRLV